MQIDTQSIMPVCMTECSGTGDLVGGVLALRLLVDGDLAGGVFAFISLCRHLATMYLL